VPQLAHHLRGDGRRLVIVSEVGEGCARHEPFEQHCAQVEVDIEKLDAAAAGEVAERLDLGRELVRGNTDLQDCLRAIRSSRGSDVVVGQRLKGSADLERPAPLAVGDEAGQALEPCVAGDAMDLTNAAGETVRYVNHRGTTVDGAAGRA